jgi:hypothetical protein
MRIGLFFIQVKDFIRCEIFHIILFREAKQHFVNVIFFRQTVAVDLYIKIIPKKFMIPNKSLFRLAFTCVED